MVGNHTCSKTEINLLMKAPLQLLINTDGYLLLSIGAVLERPKSASEYINELN